MEVYIPQFLDILPQRSLTDLPIPETIIAFLPALGRDYRFSECETDIIAVCTQTSKGIPAVSFKNNPAVDPIRKASSVSPMSQSVKTVIADNHVDNGLPALI